MFFRFFRRKYNNHSTQKNFLTQISWGSIGLCGVLFGSQNNIHFRTLEAIVPIHSFAKILIRSMIIIFTYFPVNNLLRKLDCLKSFVSNTLAANADVTRKKYEKVTFFMVMTMPNFV